MPNTVLSPLFYCVKNNYLSQLQLLLALLLAAATTARAQAEFKPGYVVLPAGDTLRGQVQEVGALRNTLTCRFRPAASAPATAYAPAELRAYGLTGLARYEARPVPPADSTQGQASRQLFVEVLVSGPAQLYACRDRPGHTRYLLAVGGPEARLRELAERRVKTFANGFEAYETRSLFRDTLAAALRACPAVQVQLPRLPFQPAALARVITSYNACVGSPVAAPVPMPHGRGPVLSLLGGYQHGTLNLNGSTAFFGLAPPLRQSSPVGGLALSMSLPHTRRTMTLRLEAQYAHEVYESSRTGPVPTAALPTPQVSTYRFDLTYLHAPVLLRYTLRRSPRLRPFVEAGFMYSRLLSIKSAFYVGTGATGPVSLPFFPADDAQYNQFGLAAGVGVSAPVLGERRLALLGRIATSNGPSSYVNIGTPITYLSVLLSLDLTKP